MRELVTTLERRWPERKHATEDVFGYFFWLVGPWSEVQRTTRCFNLDLVVNRWVTRLFSVWYIGLRVTIPVRATNSDFVGIIKAVELWCLPHYSAGIDITCMDFLSYLACFPR